MREAAGTLHQNSVSSPVHPYFMAVPNEIRGRYDIHEVLGQGGMGVVYQAYDKVVKRQIALKTIRDAPSRTALDLFQKECDVLAQISHPNIVEIFDVGEFEEDGAVKPYFVMPLLPGKTLESLIRTSSGRLTVQRVVEIISQTCRGLQAAHDRGLVHRDLKPSNIFAMDDDSVKVIDFGIAHMAETHSTMGHKGTLLYMAPEQVEMKPASSLSDIFALGVVCFETFSLRHPFERGSAERCRHGHLQAHPPSRLGTESVREWDDQPRHAQSDGQAAVVPFLQRAGNGRGLATGRSQ